MKQEDYLKARVEERKGKEQPSKKHEQSAVVQEPNTKKIIYREQL